MFKITITQRKDLLTYLGSRPYIESAPLIAMLASLKLEPTADNGKDKK
tara:strand:+ start:314 stop:457 length:144 start_codon:yes stop_codon:yes gene_type:complete